MKVSVSVIGADASAIERLTAAANRKLTSALQAAGSAKPTQPAAAAGALTPLSSSEDDADLVADPTDISDSATDPEPF
jgi:nucleoid-associated protein YgaU